MRGFDTWKNAEIYLDEQVFDSHWAYPSYMYSRLCSEFHVFIFAGTNPARRMYYDLRVIIVTPDDISEQASPQGHIILITNLVSVISLLFWSVFWHTKPKPLFNSLKTPFEAHAPSVF